MTQNLLASADLSPNTGDGTLAFDTDKRTPPLPCAVLTAKSRTASPGAQHSTDAKTGPGWRRAAWRP